MSLSESQDRTGSSMEEHRSDIPKVAGSSPVYQCVCVVC